MQGKKWLYQLVASFSLWKSRFDPQAVLTASVVDKVALYTFSPRYFTLSHPLLFHQFSTFQHLSSVAHTTCPLADTVPRTCLTRPQKLKRRQKGKRLYVCLMVSNNASCHMNECGVQVQFHAPTTMKLYKHECSATHLSFHPSTKKASSIL